MRRYLNLTMSFFIIVLSACQGTPPQAEQPIAMEEMPIQIEQPIITAEIRVPTIPTEDYELVLIPTESGPTRTQVAIAPTATVTQPAAPSDLRPTPISGDPAAVLGEPDGWDTFDSGGNWPQSTSNCFSAEVKGGKYIMTALGEARTFCWEVTWATIQDFYMEVTTQPTACSSGDLFGLFFRAPDTSRGYMYGVTCDGRYSMAMWDGSQTTVFADFIPNTAIQTGVGAVNRISVLANGSTHDLYANGTYLERVEDASFTEDGRIGFFVRPGTSQGFVTTFDDLKVWLLEGQDGTSGQTSGSDAPAPESMPIGTPQTGVPIVTVNMSLNVRSGPGTNYPAYGTLPQGQSAEVAGRSPDGAWWAIKIPTTYTPDGIGWVSAAYVTPSNMDNVIPVIQPPEPPPDVATVPP